MAKKDGAPMRFYIKLILGLVIINLIVFIVLWINQAQKNITYRVPEYAQVAAIEDRFNREITALKSEALSLNSPYQLSSEEKKTWATLFSHPSILGVQIMFLEEHERGGYIHMIKQFDDHLEMGKTGVYHPPKIGKPVVQRYISDKREIVVYEAIYEGKPRRKIELVFDLSKLE
ncbi:hypothetical protein ACFL3J_01595 [Candidatus Omnitrophota bacterium]